MFLLVVSSYVSWHYGDALRSLYRLWQNFLWFLGHFFSIRLLLGSLFSPWKRMTEKNTKKWNIEDMAATVLVNIMSRIFGAFLRLFVVLFGFLTIAIWFIAIVFLFIFWVLAPLLIAGLFIFGIISFF